MVQICVVEQKRQPFTDGRGDPTYVVAEPVNEVVESLKAIMFDLATVVAVALQPDN